MPRTLVVGGAGLVGSHLVDRLLAEGQEVIAIDDLSRGAFASGAHLRLDPRFALVEHDITRPFRAGVSTIFHLAMPSTRLGCEQDPVKAAMTCVAGTMHVLQVAAANDARLVIVPSTERWGEGIRCAEALAVDFGRARGVDVHIVRMPAAYGPRMAPDGDALVTWLVLQAVRGEPLVPRGRLDRRVRLTYVDDAVETLVRAMKSEQHLPPLVADSCEVTVGELARTVAEAAGLEGADVPEDSGDGPPSMPMSGRPALVDALPASIALEQPPPIDLREGLARTVAWFETRTGRRIAERQSGVFARRDPARATTPAALQAR